MVGQGTGCVEENSKVYEVGEVKGTRESRRERV